MVSKVWGKKEKERERSKSKKRTVNVRLKTTNDKEKLLFFWFSRAFKPISNISLQQFKWIVLIVFIYLFRSFFLSDLSLSHSLSFCSPISNPSLLERCMWLIFIPTFLLLYGFCIVFIFIRNYCHYFLFCSFLLRISFTNSAHCTLHRQLLSVSLQRYDNELLHALEQNI